MNHLCFDVYWVDYAEGIIAADWVLFSFLLALIHRNHSSTGWHTHEWRGRHRPRKVRCDPEPELQSIEPVRDDFGQGVTSWFAENELPVAGIAEAYRFLMFTPAGHYFKTFLRTLLERNPLQVGCTKLPLMMDLCFQISMGSSIEVNSLHHQSIDRLGSGFLATGLSGDQGIEAIEHTDRPIIAVQWHPEMLDRDSDPFQWLVRSSDRL